jgi:hypothetical protein
MLGQVNETIQYGQYIRPVCLSKTPVDNVNQHSGKLTTLTGWDMMMSLALDINLQASSRSNMLIQTELNVYPGGHCNYTYDNSDNTFTDGSLPKLMQSSIICAERTVRANKIKY